VRWHIGGVFDPKRTLMQVVRADIGAERRPLLQSAVQVDNIAGAARP
jgi:hypothetical protein